MKLALIGLLAAGVALLFIGKFLLKDFVKFFRVKLKFYNILPRTFVDLGQYAYTLLISLLVALLGLLCLKSLNTLFSYVLAQDLIDFYRLVRGVYSPEIAEQSPFKTSHLLSALFFNPVSQLITVFLMTATMRNFFDRINRLNGQEVYSESDTLVYGLLSGVMLIILEILLYSQNITVLSNVAHISYLVLSKMTLLLFFLAISHTHLLKTQVYKESLAKYLEVSGALKQVVYSKYGMIGIGFLIGIGLSIPFYLGTQFLDSNLLLILIFVVIFGFLYALYRAGIPGALNCLGFILLSEQHEELVQLNTKKYDKIFKRFFLVVSLAVVAFLLFHFKSFLMGSLLLLSFLILMIIGILLCYALGVGLSVVRANWLRFRVPKIEMKSVVQNGLSVSREFLQSSVPIFMVAWLVFMLISFRPHKLDYTNKELVQAVIDNNGEVLQCEASDFNPSIAIHPDEVPEFLTLCLILQEDRDFLNQRDYLPSSFVKISNWHGLSIASFYRIMSGSGGGSNCNMQILKNLGTNGRAQDLQRKITEFYSAYQLSLSHSPDQILNFYLNTVAFNGGYGHSGIVQASHHTFNRPLCELNELEMMYLVRTVVGGTFVVVNNEKIQCKEAPAYSDAIKESLLRIATSWNNQGLISEAQLNQLKFCELEFENNSKKSLQTTTREFIKKELDHINSLDHTLTSSLSKENQEKVSIAVGKFHENLAGKQKLKENRLYSAALVVDIKSGKVLAHHGGGGVTDLVDFQSGFPMASTVKPVILLQALEEHLITEDTKLFDGAMDKNTPENYRKYSNEMMSIDRIIAESPNAPVYNLKHQTDVLELYQLVEHSFKKMNIPLDGDLNFSIHSEKTSIERNYPLGQSRRMTLKDIAQVYQTILNDGVYVELNSIQNGFQVNNAQMNEQNIQRKKVFEKKNCKIIQNGMKRTVSSGTANRLLKYLPKGNSYMAKTGTSNGFIHGYTILSNGRELVVAWVSYGKNEEERLEFNDTPPIPYNSGGGSAGVLAALLLSELEGNLLEQKKASIQSKN